MKKLIIMLAMALVCCAPFSFPGAAHGPYALAGEAAAVWPAGLPVYDHIVIVIFENKDYTEIIDNPVAPYINDLLKKEGANLTRMYGEEHFSQGNYYWLFAGGNQNIGFKDQVPSAETSPDYPFKSANLGEQLISRGLSFKGYAEGLPAIGSTVEKAGPYARKHVPWISFANVPNGQTVETSCNLRFADFPGPGGYDGLPTVSIVVPNLDNDMHNCYPPNCPTLDVQCCIKKGDLWLKENLDAYYQWAKDHNSLLVVTFDENNDQRGYLGLTNPGVDPQMSDPCAGDDRDPALKELCVDLQNRIVTILAGAHIKPGDYPEGQGVTHVNILRTLEAMYGLARAGAQQPNAAGAGITDDYIIIDVFKTSP